MKNIRYIFECIILFPFFKIISLVGIDRASNFGGFVARLIGPLLPASKVAEKNLAFVFPDLPKEKQKEILLDMWDNLGRVIAELPYIHTMSDAEFSRRVDLVNGIPEIDKNIATIAVTGHFGNWEAAARTTLLISDKVSIIYRENNNPFINSYYIGMRNNRFENIPKGPQGAKDIVRAVHDKRFVCFLQDQKLNQGIEVKFFGKEAMTAKAPITLAIKFNLQLIFGYAVRTKGANFKMIYYGPYTPKDLVKDLDNYSTMQEKEAVLTQKVNEILEAWIRDNPSQWFWVHRRWSKDFYINH